MVDTPPTTSATTIVPRMPLTAFGVLISTTSPGRIRDLSTATEMRPETRSIVDTPGTSVIVITERSRAVTIALPPSSIRANPLSPVVTRSFRRTSSLNFRGAGDVASCVMVTGPTTVVATPTRACADATAQRDSLGPHAEAWPGPGSSAPRSLGLCQRAACSTATAGRAQDEHFDPALPGPRDDNGRDLRPYRQERPL